VIGADQLYVMSYSFGGSTLPTFAEWSKASDKNKDTLVTEEEWNANVATLTKGEHGILAIRSPGTDDVTTTHVDVLCYVTGDRYQVSGWPNFTPNLGAHLFRLWCCGCGCQVASCVSTVV
jgi:hypothetical protein